MPTKKILLLLVVPGVLLAAPSRRVDVAVSVPVVAQVDSPGEVLLAPGESRDVTLSVASNQAWLVSVRPDNPNIRPSGRHAGSAGGMAAAGHTFTVTLTCAADAVGPQHTSLITQLVTGPLVASLRR